MSRARFAGPAALARGAGWGWLLRCALLAGFAVLAAAAACAMGPGADYDTLNYHLYLGHAVPSGRWWRDLVPAQLQTFYPPALDMLIEALRRPLNDRPALFLSLLALPYAGCAFIAWCLQVALLAGWRPAPRAVVTLSATLLAATGAAALPCLAAPISDAPALLCLLLGVWLCWDAPPSQARLLAAGLCLGAAVGLKLTLAAASCGAGLAWLLTDATPGRIRRAAGLALGLLAGAAVTAGWWWLTLWRRTGNPLFPYYNDIFHSPLLPPLPMTDDRFRPATWLHYLFDPFRWAFQPSQAASELPARDPRLAVTEAVVLALLLLACLPPRRRPRFLDRGAAFLLILAVSAYAGWALQFGILRYLAGLEFLSGALLLIPLRGLRRRGQMVAALLAPPLAAAAIAVTLYPDWGRRPSPYYNRVVEVALPLALPPGALVVLLDPAPMAYVALALPAEVPLVGADNNIVHPGDTTALAQAVRLRLAAHPGALFGLSSTLEDPANADATLAFHHLHRAGACAPVRSSLDQDTLRLCRLARDDVTAGPATTAGSEAR